MTVHLDGMASARIADDHHNHATESTHGVSEAHHSNKTGKDTRHRNRVKEEITNAGHESKENCREFTATYGRQNRAFHAEVN
uniref:Uncharacterized protein n=1 Tax=Magallana gigas TaxID=29159 RepID=K1RE68_MAGGI